MLQLAVIISNKISKRCPKPLLAGRVFGWRDNDSGWLERHDVGGLTVLIQREDEPILMA
jgi:hypothetical protein